MLICFIFQEILTEHLAIHATILGGYIRGRFWGPEMFGVRWGALNDTGGDIARFHDVTCRCGTRFCVGTALNLVCLDSFLSILKE